MHSRPQIVVLTPVRNEAWILDLFLRITSAFADHIVIADQHSTDGSREICARYPKVHLIDNDGAGYDEASRQVLLIDVARRLVPGPRILLALDADELLAADAVNAPGWQRMLAAPPGTVLRFEKPDVVGSPSRCFRRPNDLAPIGYVDDGRPHTARTIHSTRIPHGPGTHELIVEGAVVVHFGLVYRERQDARVRFYSVVERAKGLHRFYQRRSYYNRDLYTRLERQTQPTPASWFAGWAALGASPEDYRRSRFHWHDFQVLHHFAEHGVRPFWLEDIWWFDWEGCRQEAIASGLSPLPSRAIEPPPRALQGALRAGDALLNVARRIRHRRRSTSHG